MTIIKNIAKRFCHLRSFGLLCLALSAAPTALAAVTHAVSLGDDFFSPSSLTIDPNDQVKWTWAGFHSHDTVSYSGLWDSGVMGTGSTYTKTFTTAGTFPYHCTIHVLMTASLTVRLIGAQVTITNPANGANLSAPATFTLRAKAIDSDGAITNVQFFQGATLLTNQTASPYFARVSSLAVGNYNFSACAADNRGRRATNSIVVHVIPDVVRPTLTLVSPAASQRVTNTVTDVTVIGKASDNVQVTDVQFQFNGGNWNSVVTTNGWTNWTATVTPIPGTNTIAVFAKDLSGNISLTNRRSFYYVVPSTLTLITNGIGGITHGFKGAVLEVGRTYTVTAVPGAGQVFSNWVGSLAASSAVLPFVMQPNMILQANFIRNPFLRAKGVYTGLFAETTRAHDRSGFFTLTLADHGAYSAAFKIGTNTLSFSGQFDLSGSASKSINDVQVNLNLDLAGAEKLAGTVGTADFTADLRANRSVFNALTNPATQFKGAYTLIIPGGADPAASPAGYGFGAVTVGAGGTVTLSGALADGNTLSQSTAVSRDGEWPLYMSLYGGQGSVWAWLDFDTNQPIFQISGWLSWIKPPRNGAAYYPPGFTNFVTALGSRYTGPINATTRVIALTNGIVIFDGGNLTAPFTNVVTLTSTNRVINGSPNSLSLSLTRSNGLFSGSVKVPGTTRTNTFKGVLIQGLDSGYGYFLGTNQSGSVFFGAP